LLKFFGSSLKMKNLENENNSELDIYT